MTLYILCDHRNRPPTKKLAPPLGVLNGERRDNAVKCIRSRN